MSDKPKEVSPYGQFKGYADSETVSFGWSKDKTSRHIQCILVLEGGRRIEWRGNLTDQTGRDITVGCLQTMGWDGASPLGTGDGELVGFGGPDHPVLVTIGPHTYRDKTFPQVERIDPPYGRAPAGGYLSGDEMRRLNEDIRRHMGATAPRTAPKPANAPKQAPPAARTAAPPVTGPEPARGVMGAILSDEERMRLIDQGAEPPQRPAPQEEQEEDIPF